jgi:hypothetical protein
VEHVQTINSPTVLNPSVVGDALGSTAITKKSETAADVLAAQAKAEVQARIVQAIQRPRDPDVVRQKLLKRCERTSFAQVARYSKPVGGSNVTGPSVRFVEAALQIMGNVEAKPTVIYDDREKRIVRVSVTDLETNTTYSKDILIEKTVERKQLKNGQQPLGSRINSRGERVFIVEATEDDLLNKEANLASKALRQLGLRVIDGDLTDECMDQVEATLKDKAAKDPDAEKRAIIDAFDAIGIRVEHLKAYLDVDDLATLAPKDMVNLRAIYAAIKEGETTWRELMEQREAVRGKATDSSEAAVTGKSGLLDKIKKGGQAASAPAEAADTPKGVPAQQEAQATAQNAAEKGSKK